MKLRPDWSDLDAWLDETSRDDPELRDLCRTLDLPATGSIGALKDRLHRYIDGKRDKSGLVPQQAVPESWAPPLSTLPVNQPKNERPGWPAIAFDPEVLKFVAPAYALPLAGLGLAALGIGALASVWPFLFAPAIGLHALMTANVLSRRSASDDDVIDLEALPDLPQLQNGLLAGFTRIKSTDGLKALQDLVYEYAQLQPIMARRRLTDSIVMGQVPGLASETYRQGLSVLQDALDLMEASGPQDKERLESENNDLQKEIASLGTDGAQAARVKIRRERIASNQELLALIAKQQERTDELLYQSDRCGASLHRTRMELAALRADSSEDGVSAVVDTMRLTISHARSVQDEMKRLTSKGSDPGTIVPVDNASGDPKPDSAATDAPKQQDSG